MTSRLGSGVAYFKTGPGKIYTLAYTSAQATVVMDTWSYSAVPRQGKKPIVYRDAPKLRSMTFTHTLVGDPSAPLNLSAIISALQALAMSGDQVQLMGVSTQENGYWRITDLTVTITQRTPTQQIEAASLSWSLQESAPDEIPAIGHSVNPPGAAIVGGSVLATYTVKAGDTIYSIAAAVLGDSNKWQQLATYNNLANGIVVPGQVLKIPPTTTPVNTANIPYYNDADRGSSPLRSSLP